MSTTAVIQDLLFLIEALLLPLSLKMYGIWLRVDAIVAVLDNFPAPADKLRDMRSFWPIGIEMIHKTHAVSTEDTCNVFWLLLAWFRLEGYIFSDFYKEIFLS